MSQNIRQTEEDPRQGIEAFNLTQQPQRLITQPLLPTPTPQLLTPHTLPQLLTSSLSPIGAVPTPLKKIKMMRAKHGVLTLL